MKNDALFSATTRFADDGFVTTAAEPWFKVKVELIQQYFESFVENTHARVQDIVFVDLFAGSGLYSAGAQRDLFAASSLRALETEMPVTRWVLCEENPDNARALKVRVNKYFRGRNVVILEGKSEELIEKLSLYVPVSKGPYKVAVFCVVDPFSFDIPFAVLEKLAAQGFSFVIPFTFGLSERIDYRFYIRHQRDKLVRYLGSASNFDKLATASNNHEFYKRLVKLYQNNMLMLGLNGSLAVYRAESSLMDMPNYYIGIFSRNFSMKAVRRDVQDREHLQFELF